MGTTVLYYINTVVPHIATLIRSRINVAIRKHRKAKLKSPLKRIKTWLMRSSGLKTGRDRVGGGSKLGSQEAKGTIGNFGLGVQNEAGQRLIEFCQENKLVITNSNNTRGDSTHRHHQMGNTEI